MGLPTFPRESRMRWHRVDGPGSEDALFRQTRSGWHLAGNVELLESGIASSIFYRIECDKDWQTRLAVIEGNSGHERFRFELTVDAGQWRTGGEVVPELSGALDIDLGFTPATNTLPIRRLDLGIGETAPVLSAWLRFPELRIETLAQTYTRESEHVYRYLAQVDGAPFSARLDTDDYGRVLRYEGLWVAEIKATH